MAPRDPASPIHPDRADHRAEHRPQPADDGHGGSDTTTLTITVDGANDAPDVIEEGRGILDLVVSQRVRGLNVRLTIENLTDSDYTFTQAGASDPQRLFRMGRTVAVSLGLSLF